MRFEEPSYAKVLNKVYIIIITKEKHLQPQFPKATILNQPNNKIALLHHFLLLHPPNKRHSYSSGNHLYVIGYSFNLPVVRKYLWQLNT